MSSAALISARAAGMVACGDCGTVWREVTEGAPCGRCGARLHSRKPNGLARTWAFLATAAMLYVPANLLPVMTTRSIFGTQEDTILSGIVYFWVTGDWLLAVIVFVASFVVPIFKLGALGLLAAATQWRAQWGRAERSRLYRLIELIGRWSMLDVFVVALLAGLVQLQGFAEITAGPGIACFGAVVVLTMLASNGFDPRLAWDSNG
jgi:paraquat-inducible protein A